MFGKWRERREESKAHMAEKPLVTSDPKVNFEMLQALSRRKSAGFKVLGDHKMFEIQQRSDNVLLMILIVIVLLIPVTLLVSDPQNIWIWGVNIGLIGLILAFFRYYPTSNNIRCNCYRKSLIIESNNFLSKYLKPRIEVDFADILRLEIEPVEINSQYTTSKFSRISLIHKGGSVHLIDLHAGPLHFVNPDIFVTAFEGFLLRGVK